MRSTLLAVPGQEFDLRRELKLYRHPGLFDAAQRARSTPDHTSEDLRGRQAK
jgi:hypothetical protein